MKTNKYRLETVLELRRRGKEEAARQVGVRLQMLQAAEEELARRQQRLRECFERQHRAQQAMNEQLARGLAARSILAHQNFLNDLRQLEAGLRAEVDQQIKTVARAEKDLETARDRLIEAARELKSIETHKENWKTAERTTRNRREQKISDEIGAILHGRRKGS
ncbi:MAG: flagellar export protein FliJ [Acidobacteria bacterium]|nr:flagellar export protein FliJ [Acidobacteriota bacterium]